jgi:hypothetical protein
MLRPTIIFPLSLAVIVLLAGLAGAQEARPSPADDKSYYYGPTTPTPMPAKSSYSQQKARLRAEGRIARLEEYRRLGITPNRPTAEALPFTSAYPLMWLRRSTTPVVTYQRPLMYYGYPYPLYR